MTRKLQNVNYMPTNLGNFVLCDVREVFDKISLYWFDFVFVDPPYSDRSLISDTMNQVIGGNRPAICFGYPENTHWYHSAGCAPDQIVHWVKPISTKNTRRKYSRFVEAIAVWHSCYFNDKLHWSTRTGVFTDSLSEVSDHPHQKPFSLVEKLVLLHCPPKGAVLDLFCGTRVVADVCAKHGMRSLGVDIKDWKKRA